MIKEEIKTKTTLTCDTCNKVGKLGDWISRSFNGINKYVLPIGWIENDNKHFCSNKCLEEYAVSFGKEMVDKILNDIKSKEDRVREERNKPSIINITTIDRLDDNLREKLKKELEEQYGDLTLEEADNLVYNNGVRNEDYNIVGRNFYVRVMGKYMICAKDFNEKPFKYIKRDKPEDSTGPAIISNCSRPSIGPRF
jgi:hypothetical protein